MNILINDRIDVKRYVDFILDQTSDYKNVSFTRDLTLPVVGATNKLDAYKRDIFDLYSRVNPTLSYNTHDIFFCNSGTQAINIIYDAIFNGGAGNIIFPTNESHDAHTTYFKQHPSIQVTDLLRVHSGATITFDNDQPTVIGGITLSNGSGIRLVHDYTDRLKVHSNTVPYVVLDSVHEIVFLTGRDYTNVDFIITTAHAFGGIEGSSWFIFKRSDRIKRLIDQIPTQPLTTDYEQKVDAAVDCLRTFVDNRLDIKHIYRNMHDVLFEISKRFGYDLQVYVDKFILDDYGTLYDDLIEKKIQNINFAFNIYSNGLRIEPFAQYKHQVNPNCMTYRLPRFVVDTQAEVDQTFIYYAQRLRTLNGDTR